MDWWLPLGCGILIGYTAAYIGMILDHSVKDEEDDDAPP